MRTPAEKKSHKTITMDRVVDGGHPSLIREELAPQPRPRAPPRRRPQPRRRNRRRKDDDRSDATVRHALIRTGRTSSSKGGRRVLRGDFWATTSCSRLCSDAGKPTERVVENKIPRRLSCSDFRFSSAFASYGRRRTDSGGQRLPGTRGVHRWTGWTGPFKQLSTSRPVRIADQDHRSGSRADHSQPRSPSYRPISP